MTAPRGIARAGRGRCLDYTGGRARRPREARRPRGIAWRTWLRRIRVLPRAADAVHRPTHRPRVRRPTFTEVAMSIVPIQRRCDAARDAAHRWRRGSRAGATPAPRSPPTNRRGPRERVAADASDAERFFERDRQGARRARCPMRAAPRRSGSEREGTGVVIGDDGLILTIGYLIVEADDVSIVDSSGRTLAGARRRLRPRDRASASCAPSCRSTRAPLPLGDSAKLAERDPVMIVNHGGDERRDARATSSRSARSPAAGNTCSTRRSSRRRRRSNWSGAALVDRDGKLRRRRLADRARGDATATRSCPATCSCRSTR